MIQASGGDSFRSFVETINRMIDSTGYPDRIERKKSLRGVSTMTSVGILIDESWGTAFSDFQSLLVRAVLNTF